MITKEEVELDPQSVYDRLRRAFKRKWLYDWYSRNHKRYSWAEVFIEVQAVKDEIGVDATFWSRTYGTHETAKSFYQAAIGDLAAKIVARKYRTFYVRVVGIAMWRKRKA